MHVRNANCMYSEAESSWHEALQYVSQLEQLGFTVNRATLYSEYSTLLFARSNYEEVQLESLHSTNVSVLYTLKSLQGFNNNFN